jgi:XTP/dITP diphosphohydrolase
MRTLVFATNNKNKLIEIQQLLGDNFLLKSLKDIGCDADIPESSDTLEGNALQKAEFVYQKYGLDVFADDTGLEVAELNGQPGVYSARYAGPDKSSEKNMDLLLKNLAPHSNRGAQFRTSIALILDGEKYNFEGSVAGVITQGKSGSMGFGYDPIFQPNGFDCTFAEMALPEKNQISHRGRAFRGMIQFLKKEVSAKR